jgi:hypothetical protein
MCFGMLVAGLLYGGTLALLPEPSLIVLVLAGLPATVAGALAAKAVHRGRWLVVVGATT